MTIKKIEIYGLNPDHPIATVINEINTNLDSIINAVNSIEGAEGIVGPTGAKGDQGPQGPAGIQGPQGEPGKDGRDGVDGKDGKDGLPGAVGAKGETGAQGLPGKDGKDGVNGKDGLPGTKGDTGAKGDKGDTGAMGPVGAPGAMNYSTVTSPVATVNGTGQTIATATFTSNGFPVFITLNGDANPTSVNEQYCFVQFYRDGVAIGNSFIIDSPSANINVSYNFTAYDTPTAGAHTYTLKTVAGKSFNGSFTFGEAGGPQWGFIELAGAVGPTGIGIKGFASGYVDAGQYVTLDNLKFSVTTGGQRGLCCATVSGTATLSISANYALAGGASGYATSYPGANYTTTPSGSWFGWSFANAGDGSVYNINDYTNKRFYRVTLMIGASYLGNFISIERLY